MASIFASGIACAAPITGLALLLAAVPAQAEPEGTAPVALEVVIHGARSVKGVVRLVVCPADAGFPDCGKRALKSATLPIEQGRASIRFDDIPPGTYAVGVFHDGNGNGKLDTMLGIPREGFGFSRNPPLRPRAPRFDEAMMPVRASVRVDINLRYII